MVSAVSSDYSKLVHFINELEATPNGKKLLDLELKELEMGMKLFEAIMKNMTEDLKDLSLGPAKPEDGSNNNIGSSEEKSGLVVDPTVVSPAAT
jgi:hypothetical protein